MYKDVQNNIIYKRQKLERAQMSSNRREKLTFAYNEILNSNEHEL